MSDTSQQDLSSAQLLDSIRANGGARSFDEETFLAKWIVDGVCGGLSGDEAIAALELHVDMIYAVTRGLLSGTHRATIEACYARRAELRRTVQGEYLDDDESLSEALAEEELVHTEPLAQIEALELTPVERDTVPTPLIHVGQSYVDLWREVFAIPKPLYASKAAIDVMDSLTDDEYARYVRDLQGSTS